MGNHAQSRKMLSTEGPVEMLIRYAIPVVKLGSFRGQEIWVESSSLPLEGLKMELEMKLLGCKSRWGHATATDHEIGQRE